MAALTQEALIRILPILAKAVTAKAGSRDLTNEELSLVFSVNREGIQRILSDMEHYSLSWCEAQLRYRQRRKELGGFPTEELRNRYDRIASARSRAIAADEFDTADDSLYESPPIDSDEHILWELLEERRLEEVNKIPF